MQINAQAVGRGGFDHAALVARIAAGDPSAETEFVLAFQAGVRALVRRHARPADPVVDDLAQDVLHTLVMRLRDNALHDAATLPAYVRSTVVFVVTAEYRKRGRRGENDSAPQSTDDLPDPDQPDRHACREQLRGSVNRVLAELGMERDREVLRRYYLKEEDRDTVCAALVIEPDHFHRVLHRARTRMKELLVERGIASV